MLKVTDRECAKQKASNETGSFLAKNKVPGSDGYFLTPIWRGEGWCGMWYVIEKF